MTPLSRRFARLLVILALSALGSSGSAHRGAHPCIALLDGVSVPVQQFSPDATRTCSGLRADRERGVAPGITADVKIGFAADRARDLAARWPCTQDCAPAERAVRAAILESIYSSGAEGFFEPFVQQAERATASEIADLSYFTNNTITVLDGHVRARAECVESARVASLTRLATYCASRPDLARPSERRLVERVATEIDRRVSLCEFGTFMRGEVRSTPTAHTRVVVHAGLERTSAPLTRDELERIAARVRETYAQRTGVPVVDETTTTAVLRAAANGNVHGQPACASPMYAWEAIGDALPDAAPATIRTVCSADACMLYVSAAYLEGREVPGYQARVDRPEDPESWLSAVSRLTRRRPDDSTMFGLDLSSDDSPAAVALVRARMFGTSNDQSAHTRALESSLASLRACSPREGGVVGFVLEVNANGRGRVLPHGEASEEVTQCAKPWLEGLDYGVGAAGRRLLTDVRFSPIPSSAPQPVGPRAQIASIEYDDARLDSTGMAIAIYAALAQCVTETPATLIAARIRITVNGEGRVSHVQSSSRDARRDECLSQALATFTTTCTTGRTPATVDVRACVLDARSTR